MDLSQPYHGPFHADQLDLLSLHGPYGIMDSWSGILESALRHARMHALTPTKHIRVAVRYSVISPKSVSWT